ncbi:hypothetical protein GCM10008908_12320 [Clostridium subterminale]|uniref:Uncharacterized protein n=1 Tax=Clostridium subterminale TaxID=1550 RepID=A0ABN1KLD8_CLOSU
MKRFTIILLILVTLIFSTSITTPAFAENLFKEGFYEISDFNPSKNGFYHAKNISTNDIYIIIFNEKLIATQVLYLGPKSLQYNLVPLTSEHTVIIVGDGQVHIDTGTR